MENAVWSVIKYKPKDGCSDAFKEALGRLAEIMNKPCLLYTSPSPRDYAASRMPSSA